MTLQGPVTAGTTPDASTLRPLVQFLRPRPEELQLAGHPVGDRPLDRPAAGGRGAQADLPLGDERQPARLHLKQRRGRPCAGLQRSRRHPPRHRGVHRRRREQLRAGAAAGRQGRVLPPGGQPGALRRAAPTRPPRARGATPSPPMATSSPR